MTTELPISEIPKPYRERYVELIEIIDEFCDIHLNEEYKTVCHTLVADLCYDCSPVLSGKTRSWAGGLIWAIARVNFLSDPASDPTMTQADFCRLIGVSPATISAKCRVIWNEREMMPLDPAYTVASRLETNPLIWLVEVNGLIVDLRSAPRELQEAAFEQGIIPFVPKDRAKK